MTYKVTWASIHGDCQNFYSYRWSRDGEVLTFSIKGGFRIISLRNVISITIVKS